MNTVKKLSGFHLHKAIGFSLVNLRIQTLDISLLDHPDDELIG